MSDLIPMYARLRGTLADQQPAAAAPCRHPRPQQRIERTEEDIRGGNTTAIVRVTTEIHCNACGAIVGRETHNERRR
ncbi:7-keto-8-aminopelargonate synthetase-like enzyme [Mycolicibacterium canariasense]|uniref:7-keto-8-aminopelargonate synthetase-like enzyme n=1 Tax=Mycolicibacterium canariasense TaxID=228230 RepID=A0A117I9A0_MYCCR|nr:hypothetical protein [Mycolicibacterium canariasense]MCV7208817.1 hypothetical protein [Mycolicibacterium canariasense]ORV07118.1 hypothetical protein AWB94_14040 [Mycolicibacterium canariasense]GAS94395.1 7-keto-8-aminopelargonate synthetase-like enzyme [Mycolicibacterium canariasense]